ncbi:EAL domain-containing protein [Enterobacter bugandensis]|nr:EAL domain-containing protein [Enterobacter bugandensis]EKS7120225.1 EAL domain-containing protein [Enterobacter bugandensis]HEM8065408.1 EAL domain-containing protein [Enterobacter hormaechei]
MMLRKLKVMPLLLAMLFLMIGIFTSWFQWNKQKERELQSAVTELLYRTEAIFDDASMLATAASEHINTRCTDDVIRTLSRLTASLDTIRSVNIIENGEWYCSSLEGRESLGIVSAGTTTPKIMIEEVYRQKTQMYMTYFPFKGEVVAVAVYKAAIDHLIQNYIRSEKANFAFSLRPASEQVHALRSSEYPFSISLTSFPKFSDYINENLYIISLFILLSFLFFFHLRKVQKNSPARAISQAIKNNEFVPYYQPVVDLNSERIIGAEVLVRWLHPEQGLITPNEFINTAEQTGLVKPMTLSLMNQIMIDIKRIGNLSGKPFHLGINLPPATFNDNEFINKVIIFINQIKKMNVSVMIEITERQQNQIDSAVLSNIRKTGAEIALDDFGTGFSNYQALEAIKPSFIKIDKMFIDSLGMGGVNEAIVYNIVQLSNLAGVPLIAEGIETTEQLSKLREAGVEYGQGYLFSKPVIIEDIINSMEALRAN